MGKISLVLGLLLAQPAMATTTFYYKGKVVSKLDAFKIASKTPTAVFAKVVGHAVMLNPSTLRFKKSGELTNAVIKDLVK